MPFERLIELVAALSEDEERLLGMLAGRWRESPERISDAIDALRVLYGERAIIPIDALSDPDWKPGKRDLEDYSLCSQAAFSMPAVSRADQEGYPRNDDDSRSGQRRKGGRDAFL
jgi:hypothetical protein